MKKYLIILSAFFLVSCAHIISKENVALSVKDIPFSKIQETPELYLDKIFIFGGFIAKTTNSKQGSEIEIVQNPIDSYGSVFERDLSEGRFLITTSKYLDPLIYRKGRSLTMAGKLIGSKKNMLGEIEYNYPVFELKEIYLWKEVKLYPYYYNYDPFYNYAPYYPSSPYYWNAPYSPYNWYGPYFPRPYIYP
jgi:outer membrane lipoprotein